MPDDAPEPQLPAEFGEANAGALFARAAPPREMPAGDARRWTPPAIEELQRALPQYEVTAMLGIGGMGAVYKATQRSLDRVVAIKILPPGIADEHEIHYAERFKLEAKAMARLDHPGIVSVFDAGETSEGQLYFVMQFIEGTDLQQLLAQGPLPPERAVAIATHVCEALAFAHDSGIVHRDIKPSNIMLDRHGRVKVADFGLAKVTAHESAGFTRTNLVMGTPDFMAPESIKSTASVDQRADLYAVGVMLYAMLTGNIPRGRFTRPSEAIPDLDPQFDVVVDKALQANPDQRYPSAAALRADLARVRTGPIIVVPPRRRRAPLLIAALVVVLAATTVERVLRTRSGPARPAPSRADREFHLTNSLGMKFVFVPITGGPTDGQRVLFSVWETRVQDYEVFARETKREWKKPDFAQGPTHPVVMMSWDDAQAFCAWLTEREHKAGMLGVNERYRLPSDREWSCAVGIADREDATVLPGEKSQKLKNVYPWGSQWPPPTQAGNYRSEEMRPLLQSGKYAPWNEVLPGYRDGHSTTAPVGSYPASPLGLHDLGGNAWEWCEDWREASHVNRVCRGASWFDAVPELLLSSNVHGLPPDKRANGHGFRVVLAESAPVASAVSAGAAAATKDAPFANTLGMKFLPVPITGGPTDGARVLFSVWETRVQDYAEFASETNRNWPGRAIAPGPTHPAVMMSWDDAQAFCAWLTQRERKAGTLGAAERYRLPSDHEWSCAVGIGPQEDPAKWPKDKTQKLADVFPWGNTWPPPANTGNFASEEWVVDLPDGASRVEIIPGYRDGYARTAPVGSFAPSPSGLYDLEGNVREWCEDWFDATHQGRVSRGAGWSMGGGSTPGPRNALLSSSRSLEPLNTVGDCKGFRVVLAK